MDLQVFPEIHRESQQRFFMSALIFFVLFGILHSSDFLGFASIAIVLAYLSWQIATVARKWFPGRRVSSRNKAVLITGCDSGFGHGLARKLCQEGYTVMAACLFPEGKGAKSLREDFSANNMHVFQMDVTKDDDVRRAVQEIKSVLNDTGKKLWAVVNNAGICSLTPFEVSEMSDYQNVTEVNQLGVVRVTRAFIPLVRECKGRIILVASILGRMSMPYIVPYCMSKHAVVAFADGLRRELPDVKFITIEPALYRTGIVPDASAIRQKLEKAWENADPEVRAAYDRESLENTIQAMIKSSQSANPRISDVIDTMADAVCLENPPVTNRVAGVAVERYGLWLYDIAPVFIQDLIANVYFATR